MINANNLFPLLVLWFSDRTLLEHDRGSKRVGPGFEPPGRKKVVCVDLYGRSAFPLTTVIVG